MTGPDESADDDPAVWLAKQSDLLSEARQSKHPAWDTFDEALRVAQHARRPAYASIVSVLGELSLIGIGASVALLSTYLITHDAVSQKEWLILLGIAIPSTFFYAIYLQHRFG